MAVLFIIFWFSLGLLTYSYLLYPLLLKILASAKQGNTILYNDENLPDISILIAAHNEQDVIEEKLKSIFSGNYPKDKIEVHVGSDASSDHTDDVVNDLGKKYAGLHLTRFTARSGKVHIINRLAEIASSPVLIITDANVIFEEGTIKELVKHFANPSIALVDSHMRHKGQKKGGIAHGESFYIRNEVDTKNNEGIIWGTMMGPFGGCYAVRKELFSQVPENFLVDDFYINMKVLEKGGKAISETKSIVYEDVSNNVQDEFRRKVRIATGSFQNLFALFNLLIGHGAVSFCFFSHKVVRWFGPVLIIAISIIGFKFAYTNEFFAWFFWFELLFTTFIVLDYLLSNAGINFRFLRIIRHFFFTNLAVFIGMVRAMKGVRAGIWQPTKRNQ